MKTAAIFAALLTLSGCKAGRAKHSTPQEPRFQIRVSLTEAAQKKIKAAGETIAVAAYFGDTTGQNPEESLPDSRVDLPGPGIAQFANIRFPDAALKKLKNPDYEVLINVFSGRRSSKFNLLSCGILEDRISQILDKTFDIKCDLIQP